MSIVEKLAEPHDINNMEIFNGSHFKNYIHAPNNKMLKIMDDVITQQTTNLLNNDDLQIKVVDLVQENYNKDHVSNLHRPLMPI